MLNTAKHEYKNGIIANPNFINTGENYISIYTLSPDMMRTIYHTDGNSEISLTDIERGNILEFGNYQNEKLSIRVAIVMSVTDDQIIISYKTSLEEAIFGN